MLLTMQDSRLELEACGESKLHHHACRRHATNADTRNGLYMVCLPEVVSPMTLISLVI